MRVLLVDNYDSFAWNLVQGLRALGADVVVRRNDAVSVPQALAFGADAFVLSPGPGAPAAAGVSVDLVRAAAAERVPLLGVCLGHQAVGEAFGAATVRAAAPVHGKTSVVAHDGGPEFAGVASPFEAMRYHSLRVGDPLPHALVRTAWTLPCATSPRGGEVMALRHRTLPILAFQFHPESYMTPHGPRLLANFLAMARSAGASLETSR